MILGDEPVSNGPRGAPQSNFFHFHAVFSKNCAKQECIPVGCVPAARRPYAGVCFPGEGCLLRGGSGPGGSVPGGSGPGGGGIPACTEADPPPCEQNDKQV